MPKELWAARIESVAQSGYHALDVYIPWNYHEPERGEYLFDGDRDVRAFLRLARDAGLYVIARPGPYICSEWDGGALPAWLYPAFGQPEADPRSQTTFHSGHRILRQADERFLREVARWYDAVLPILREEQLDAGGAVLAVQIDNELDFYPCADPKGYLSFLKECVKSHGITVPILACSGEDGVSKATGDLEGVVPTANIYSRYRAEGLEERARRVRDELLQRNAPLSVTETDRNHFTLRRLLSAGAHFLGPYLQVSGHHTGYFAGQNNWGKPSTFLQNDYDFGGMVGPDGELREEFYEARILSGMIAAFESELVAAQPGNAVIRTTAPGSEGQRRVVSALSCPSGARFLFIPNLQDEPLEVIEPIRVTVPPHRVAVAASDIDFASSGIPVTLLRSNAEIARLTPTSRGCVAVVAYDPISGAELVFEADPEGAITPAYGDVQVIRDQADHETATGQVEASPRGERRRWRVVVPPGKRGEVSGEGPSAAEEAHDSEAPANGSGTGDDGLKIAVLSGGETRLVLVFAPRPLAARAWEVNIESDDGAVLEIGWDWMSADGSSSLLHCQRDVYRIMADGSAQRLEKRSVARHVRRPWLPATPAREFRLVEKRAPIDLLARVRPHQSWQGDARYLESLGVHYGAAYYRFTVDIGAASLGEQEGRSSGAGAAERTPGLWIGGASDAVSFYINGIYMGTALPRGRSVWLVGRLPWRTGENEIVVRTEIMGHSNFHDATVPVTHLGSMRGLAPPVLISERTPGAGEYEEHVRTASMPSRDASFIYGAPQPGGRVVDAAWQLWRASIVEEEAEGALGAVRPFPLKLSGGEFAELQVVPPSLDGHLPLWVRLLGQGIKGELWLSRRLVGRFWLQDHPDLLFTGGRWRDRIWLPHSWLGDAPLTIRLMGADRRGGILNGIEWLESIGGRSPAP